MDKQLLKGSRFDKFTKNLFGEISRVFSKAQAQIAYDFWKRINSNEISNSIRPGRAAVKWYKDYSKDSDVQLRRSFMKQGGLYIFDYKNPKYKDTLDYFDKQPLVLCLGQTATSTEFSANNIGINLHLLPPRVRRLVLFEVWKMYKSGFKKNLFSKDQKQVNVSWQALKKPLEKYGVDFAIRSYIPPRQANVIEFRTEDFGHAIWIPSAGYSKITAPALEKRWREHIRKQKLGVVTEQSHMSGPV